MTTESCNEEVSPESILEKSKTRFSRNGMIRDPPGRLPRKDDPQRSQERFKQSPALYGSDTAASFELLRQLSCAKRSMLSVTEIVCVLPG